MFFLVWLALARCLVLIFRANYKNLVWKALMWRGSTRKTQNWVSEGTAEAEQGWFKLALYNLSNLFLMLTVQYFVSHFKTQPCVKTETFVYLLFESEHGNSRQRAVFVPWRVTRGPLCYSAIYQNTFLQYFVRSKTSTFLKPSSFVLYLFYIRIQHPAQYGLWTEVTFHLGCQKCLTIRDLREAITNTPTNMHSHSASHSQSCGSACQLCFAVDDYTTRL